MTEFDLDAQCEDAIQMNAMAIANSGSLHTANVEGGKIAYMEDGGINGLGAGDPDTPCSGSTTRFN